MSFYSILFKEDTDSIQEAMAAPDFFVDLNLDQVIDKITAGKQQYNLKPFFYTPLKDIDAINYRYEVMQELENKSLFESITSFAQKMSTVRMHLGLTDKLYYKYNKEGWFLEAVDLYCDAVNCLAHDLTLLNLKSRGFLSFNNYIQKYITSDKFTSLRAETKNLKEQLSTVKYCINIRGNCIQVRKYEQEDNYNPEIEASFSKFKQNKVKDYLVNFTSDVGMNHIEAKILDLVAKLYPDVFLSLDKFCLKYQSFMDQIIVVFDREVQFYIAYIEFIEKFREKGLDFCYPLVSDKCKEVYDYDGFDIALAIKLLINGKSDIVYNDFHLKGQERIIVVTGPNQGGKTTFARLFGQVHYLASLGCPVPGKKAQLFLADRLFTHFEKEENIKNLRGKLQDDLVRIYNILEQATTNSIIILNEIFTSTTLEDSIFLSKKILEKIINLDLLCVCVTFIDELASLDAKIISMVSIIDEKNPLMRTYKIKRRPADGLSYAITIAEKYRLTYECLKERIK